MAGTVALGYTIDRVSGQFDVSADYYIPPYTDPETFEYFAATQWSFSYYDQVASQVGTSGDGWDSGFGLIYIGFAPGETVSDGTLDFTAFNSFSGESASVRWHVLNAGLAGEAKILAGGDGVDIVIGGAGDDELSGGADNDVLDGGDGADAMDGGEGADRLTGGAGDDTMRGGAGDDLYDVDAAGDRIEELAGGGYELVFATVSYSLPDEVEDLSLVIATALDGTGNGQHNRIDGNGSDNLLSGQGGNDRLFGYQGADQLVGGEGADLLDGGSGADRMAGGSGDDSFVVDSLGDVIVELAGEGVDEARAFGLHRYAIQQNVEDLTNLDAEGVFIGYGNAIGNVISGAAGVDRLFGLGGQDTLRGADGADLLEGGADGDRIEGGVGKDTASYARSLSGVQVNLATGAASGGDAEGDTLLSIEGLRGSAHDDVLTGDGRANTLAGGAGADQLDGGLGNDVLLGGAGADVLVGGGGQDSASYAGSALAVTVDLATGTAQGGDAEGDTLDGIGGVIGSALDDTLGGSEGANRLAGGDGADHLDGREGADILIGGAGGDVLAGGDGSDILDYGGSSEAVVVDLAAGTASGGDAAGDSWTSIENLAGSAHADVLTGDGLRNLLRGMANDDMLAGGEGDDVIVGGAGADTMDGGAGRDTLSYAGHGQSISVSLADGRGLLGDAQGDTFTGFENLRGGEASDALYGDGAVNRIDGGGNGDYIDGAGGNDVLIGRTGDDGFYIGAGSGSDRILDFTAGGIEDRILVNLSGYTTLVQVMAVARQDGSTVVLDFAPDLQLRLENVLLADLTAQDFVFSL
ncbi:calcium-binding protein [Novosphingobium cyanobacteriorum]|uniref:Calcium-binding protein n=1 Tax=Novosphingobium cyanobacteriorum TaxID=3024215 RepID=A0ABT6CFR6_9SPHN|nr:calcium-binding protein [Novosphingobium cyanobacteriorum]MDF8332374.1 calcium-binding protein [Novosphingobium cyanobacteriorum]